MHIQNKDIEKLASMSKLRLSPEEVSKYTNDANEILSYVDLLNEVDTSNLQETNQVTGLTNVTYPDQVHSPFSPDIAERVLKSSGQPIEMKQIKVPNVL